jgi:hypothetical protein
MTWRAARDYWLPRPDPVRLDPVSAAPQPGANWKAIRYSCLGWGFIAVAAWRNGFENYKDTGSTGAAASLLVALIFAAVSLRHARVLWRASAELRRARTGFVRARR